MTSLDRDIAAVSSHGPSAGLASGSAPDVSVVVPTLNEAGNIVPVTEAVRKALAGYNWEIIFVDDDSKDGTADAARRVGAADPRVRCIRRIGRRGLSGAAIEGILASSAFAVAVMDADMQHDETLLPDMLEQIRAGADLVVGTRNAEGGSAGDGLSQNRKAASDLATWAAQRLLGVSLSDPMSGFFMIRRETADRVAPKLSTQGFKILLDLIASSDEPLKIVERPYQFRKRLHGASKLDSRVVAEYAGLLISKASGDLVSARFLSFAMVGASGLFVHMAALAGALDVLKLGFDFAQLFAAVVAMTWNFILNNWLTYRDRRLKGLDFVTGLLSFYAVCSVGAVANVGVASWVYGQDATWWLAGIAGALMGAVFNYSASAAFTWRAK
ncbi:MAG: glycosyltransferase family 2 protein [Hyphomicrobium sp.]|nr:glycosyltransferase family 2 protein [Hyphomicrobium sp.]